MKSTIFQALTTQLQTSQRVAAPEVTGHTIYFRTRPAFDSVKYVARRDRLTGYVKVHNLKLLGVDPTELLPDAETTKKGDIKLAALNSVQLVQLYRLIVRLKLRS